MKTLIIAILICLSLPAFSFQKLIPGDHVWSYEEAHTGFMGWVIDELGEAGYDVPKEGEEFCWAKYLSPVEPTDKPKKWDIVQFIDDKGEKHGALVVTIAESGRVLIKQPLGDGVAIFLALDPIQAVGYLRPHPAGTRDKPQI